LLEFVTVRKTRTFIKSAAYGSKSSKKLGHVEPSALSFKQNRREEHTLLRFANKD